MEKDPHLSKAPAIIRDELLFPYLAGTSFTQQFLKANSGWKDLPKLFQNPPVSSQQIIHPELYFKGVKPEAVTLPKWAAVVPPSWKLLEENVLGEFGLQEVLKEFIGDEMAKQTAPFWAGDRYSVFEDQKTKITSLIVRIHLDNDEDAARFFGKYSEALEFKHKTRAEMIRRPNFFQFKTEAGKVFLRCLASDCLSVEQADRDTFDKINHALGWPPAPADIEPVAKPTVTQQMKLQVTATSAPRSL
jgi:hypothetical protein